MQSSGSEYLDEQYYDSVGVDESHVSTGLDTMHQSASSDQTSILQLRAQYAEELKQVEEEIQTLKQVLQAKHRRQHFLKRQLGISVISELREEVNKGMDNLRTSEAYQKTTAAVKTAKEKTSSALYEKWNVLRQTNAFKSFEDKLGTAYSSVRLPSALTQLAISGPAVVGKLVRSATVTGDHSVGQSAPNMTNNVQPLAEVTWSKDTGIDNGTSASKPGFEAPATDNKLLSTNGTTETTPTVGKIQLEQLSLDEHESDETEEFVQPTQPTKSSKRKQKQKPKSFAD